MRFFLLSLCLSFGVSCAKSVEEAKPQVVIERTGSDMQSIKCHFTPPVDLVENFFSLAKPMSPQEEHQFFGWTPCFIEGRWKRGSEWKLFKLRPTGSAQVEKLHIKSENERYELLGCVECSVGLQAHNK